MAKRLLGYDVYLQRFQQEGQAAAAEQARNCHLVDRRVDLYSLGCTFFFRLTGRPSFVDGTLTQRIVDHQNRPPLDVRKLRGEVPAELAYLCHKLLAKNSDDRVQSAMLLASAMENWLRRYEYTIQSGS